MSDERRKRSKSKTSKREFGGVGAASRPLLHQTRCSLGQAGLVSRRREPRRACFDLARRVPRQSAPQSRMHILMQREMKEYNVPLLPTVQSNPAHPRAIYRPPRVVSASPLATGPDPATPSRCGATTLGYTPAHPGTGYRVRRNGTMVSKLRGRGKKKRSGRTERTRDGGRDDVPFSGGPCPGELATLPSCRQSRTTGRPNLAPLGPASRGSCGSGRR